MSRADPLAGWPIGRGLRITVFLVACIAWATALGEQFATPSFYPAWFAVVSYGLVGLVLLLSLAQCRTPTGPLVGMRLYVGLALVLRWAELAVVTPPPGSVGYAPLSNILFSGMVLTGFCLRATVGAPMVLAAAIGFLPARIEVVGTLQGVAEGAVYLAASGAPFLVVARLGRELRRLGAAGQAAHQERARAVASAERARLHEWWDGLIHDQVLAALNLAAHGQVAAAATPARQAVGRLSDVEAGPVSRPDAIARHARSLRVDVDLDLHGWSEGAAGDTLEAATCEAITNVSRHSGVRAARVSSSCLQGLCRVTVRDEGRGFDLSSVPDARLGVRRRILGGLEAIGGHASIDSAVGEGTTVRLSAPLEIVPPAAPPPERWRLRIFLPVALLAALHMGAHIAVGTTFLFAALLPAIAVAGMALIPALTVLVAMVPARGPAWAGALVAIALTWGVLIGNVRDPDIGDWRLWFVGAFDTAVVIVGLRRGIVAAFAVVTAASGLGLAVSFVRGEVALVPIAVATFQCYAWSIGAGGMKLVLDRAGRRILSETADRAEAAARSLAVAAREVESQARRAALDAEVVPYLERIAEGDELGPCDRARCADLESVARDLLVAGTLLPSELAASIAEARARGVVVTVVGRRDGSSVEAFHEVVAGLLRAARPRDRLQLTWRLLPDGRCGVGSLVGDGAGEEWTSRFPSRVGGVGITVSVDEDSVLVELQAADTAQGSRPAAFTRV